jgi:hypothetical protein
MAPVLEGKTIDLDQKIVLKGELLIWRTKSQAMNQGTAQLKDSICFKWVQIDPTKLDPGPLSQMGLRISKSPS